MLDGRDISSEPRPMYRIIGADQKEYGPVTVEEIRAWIAEGRANGQTLARFEGGPWKALSTFPEFTEALRAASTSAPPPLPLSQAALTGNAPATNSMAVAGLVTGIFSLFCCGVLVGVLGIVFSSIALSQIKTNPEQYSGRGMATAGLIISVLGVVLHILLMILFGFTGLLKEIMPH